MTSRADIGLIGLAVMGQNLVLNMDDHGYTVAVHNRTRSKVDEFLGGAAAGTRVVGTDSLESLVALLERPRRVMLMVKAGAPVDDTIESLVPLLEPGDIVIDGGNSHFADTERRLRSLAGHGIRFVGTGVSGGEEGARHGPSIMPGGDPEAWPAVQGIFRDIAAKARDGSPCCDWVGSGGAGHFVKMVHNGIEYGDMQVIAEAYWLLRAQGRSHPEMAAIFREWGAGILDSYLIDITADILAFTDEDGSPLVENILDAAGQKGTGKWTAISALDLGRPMTLVAEAVFARIVSSLKDERVRASAVFRSETGRPDLEVLDVRDALYASKLISYTQGFMVLRAASQEYGWDLDPGVIAGLWRAGCIIRAAFLDDITAAFQRAPELEALVLDPFFADAINGSLAGWRKVVSQASLVGLPVPAYASALSFFDGYRSASVPANLIQAQRDYFGAHTYERVDGPRGTWFHTDWTGTGGSATSSTYSA